ncbi:MAG TPA: hypothetical protein VN690_12625 [Terriglobales bacterium]|nr:hypothetical protein [Terriglobales bacterium]
MPTRRKILPAAVVGLLLGLGILLGAQGTPPATPAATTDSAYAAGYNAAYPLGQEDQRSGAPANAHKFRIYQDGTSGYTEAYGTPEAYRSGFQSGFDDGYADGYGQRPRSVPEAAAPAEPAANPPEGGFAPPVPPTMAPATTDVAKAARANGYREGYNVGQSDANSHAVYDAAAHREYQDANVGYDPAQGASDQYQASFRSGFNTGYDDGFNHRLYNAALGARSGAAASSAGNAGASDLPTDPVALRAQPSGVYNDVLLLAQGTRLHTTLDKQLDTKNSYSGEAFSLTVTVPVWIGGTAAIPAGSTIQGTVQQVTRGGKLSGHAQLQLQYNTLTLPGRAPISLNATTAATGSAAQKVNQDEGTVNGPNSNAGKRAGTDAAVGAVLGGIFGGTGGLIRGGAAGAAIGTAGVLMSHSRDLTLREGEPMLIRLEEPLELPKPPNSGQ